jgi:short-subunit dehydrogenase
MVVTKFAIELKKDGITVLALSPGLVNTAEKQRKSDPNQNKER